MSLIPRCTNNPAELGPQDLVIIALKAHSITRRSPGIAPAPRQRHRHPHRGQRDPYWYFYAHGGMWQDSIVESVDPSGGAMADVGAGSARSAVSFIRDRGGRSGVIQHVYGNKLPIGEPMARSARASGRLPR